MENSLAVAAIFAARAARDLKAAEGLAPSHQKQKEMEIRDAKFNLRRALEILEGLES